MDQKGLQNKELLSRIENSRHKDSRGQDEVVVPILKYMIIRIKDKKYAIYAHDVREIIGGSALFYVPFTPPYIRGFINRHGEPYTVIDLTVIFERENLDSSTYLILNRDDDQLALIISDVLEIVKLPESDLHKMTSKVQEDDYFTGSISPQEGEEIFVLDLDSVLKKLGDDLDGV